MSISTRLRWSYLVSSALPLILVGTLLIVLNLNTQQRSVYTGQSGLATNVADTISAYIQGVEAQILRFGRTIRTDVSHTLIDVALNSFMSSNPDVRQLTILDNTGKLIDVYPHITLGTPLDTSAITDDPLVRSALRQGIGGRSDLYRLEGGETLLTIVIPMRNEIGAISGVISAQVRAARMAQILRGVDDGATRTAYLVSRTYEVMLTDGNLRWRRPPSLDTRFSNAISVTEYADGRGARVIGARAEIKPNGWWVIVEKASNEAFADTYRNVLLLGGLVTLVVVLAFGWALLQAGQLLRPLKALRAGAEAFGTGNLQYRITPAGSTELVQVAQTFNQMADQLQHSLSAIAQQNEHLRNGLLLARDIQMGLLPSQPPWNSSLQVCARSIPAYEVGGDFYTYASLPAGQAAIAIGDISGKGVAAALLMALTSSMVETHARQNDHPADLLRSLNHLLSPRLRANRMNAALLCAIFDLDNYKVMIANAGMIAPLFIRPQPDGGAEVSLIDVSGFPLGSMPQAIYADTEIKLSPGDLLLFVSDGVVEAHDTSDELYGFERLEALMATMLNYDPVTIVTTILKDIQAYIGNAEQHDDITIIVVRPTFVPNVESAMSDAGVPYYAEEPATVF